MRWWLVALVGASLLASCLTGAHPPKRPLCGPDHPEYLGGCDLLAERRWRK